MEERRWSGSVVAGLLCLVTVGAVVAATQWSQMPATPSSPEPEEVPAAAAPAAPAHAALLGEAWSTIDDDPEAALATFDKVIAEDPSNGEAWYGRGYLMYRADRLTEAGPALCKGLELGPPELRPKVQSVLDAAELSCGADGEVTKAAPPELPTKTLVKIRANRRVLAYVDGRVVGYTPQDVEVTAGAHEIITQLPGQPASRQTRKVQVTDEPVQIDLTY